VLRRHPTGAGSRERIGGHPPTARLRTSAPGGASHRARRLRRATAGWAAA